MVWGVGFVLTIAVVIFVGYPLFAREEEPVEDNLELAIAQRRGTRGAGARTAPAPARPVAARATVRCGKCGAANLNEDRFCARCGTELGSRCANCGSPYQEGDAFCAKCGTRLAGRQ